jgi:hypothetical protein
MSHNRKVCVRFGRPDGSKGSLATAAEQVLSTERLPSNPEADVTRQPSIGGAVSAQSRADGRGEPITPDRAERGVTAPLGAGTGSLRASGQTP